jgi:hypothetical protein
MPEIDGSIRDFVRRRAGGYCEYCRISERFTLALHEIDHVVAVKHGGESTLDNMALCCTICNRFKGSDIASIDPLTGDLTPLFNPRLDSWDEHHQLREGEILPLSAKGRVTVRLLQMNSPARIKERSLISKTQSGPNFAP